MEFFYLVECVLELFLWSERLCHFVKDFGSVKFCKDVGSDFVVSIFIKFVLGFGDEEVIVGLCGILSVGQVDYFGHFGGVVCIGRGVLLRGFWL
jgi:hypothetical protein